MNFISPYLLPLYSAAWNVEQSLEELGWSSSNFVVRDASGHLISSYWSPAEAVLPVFGLLIVVSVLVSCSVVTAGYILVRKRGALIALIAIFLPGLLNTAGLWPSISGVPDTFVIGAGQLLGSTLGMATLVGLGAVAGWCLLLACVDLFPARERFWLTYEHLWYGTGLLAGIIFVADSHVVDRARRLQEVSRNSQQASAYLLKQVGAYDQWCNDNEHTNLISCRWASEVQQKLLDYSIQAPVLYSQFGPATSADIYAAFGRSIAEADVTQIRLEIAHYNRMFCPVTDLGGGVQKLATLSKHCQNTPATFLGAFPDALNGKVDKQSIFIPVALDIEGIIPTLVRSREEQEALTIQVGADERTKHYRWMYYLLFSIVIGGKIAGATVKLAKIDKRPPGELRRSLHFSRRIASAIGKFIHIIIMGSLKILRSAFEAVGHIFRRIYFNIRKLRKKCNAEK